MTKGWKLESARHSLARRGVKTKGIEEDPQRMWNVRVAAHADAAQKAKELPIAEELLDLGDIVDEYPIDETAEGELESNAGTEYLIKYKGKKYFVQEWEGDPTTEIDQTIRRVKKA